MAEMDTLYDFFICAILALILIGFFENLVNEKFRPYVKLVSGLFMLVILVDPLLSSVNDLVSDLEINEDYASSDSVKPEYSSFVSVFEEQLCASVCDYLVTNTDIREEQIRVEAVIDDSDMSKIKIELIKVTLNADYDINTVNRLISTFYNTKTETVIEYEKAD